MSLFKAKTDAAEKVSSKPGKRVRRGKIPDRVSINLVRKEKQKLNLVTFIPAVLLIIVAAALISKFAVVDLLTDLNDAQQRVFEDQMLLDTYNNQINSYGELTEEYAHYTTSGMDSTELTAVSREEILTLLREQVMPYATIGSWSVSYNTVSLPVTCSTLQEINEMVQRLNEDDRVEYCVVSSANGAVTEYTYYDSSDDDTDDEGASDAEETESKQTAVVKSDSTTTAQVTIYMADPEKGAE